MTTPVEKRSKIRKKTVYKEAFFYFMSGTGNSYRVANWLKEMANEQGILSRIHSVDIYRLRPKLRNGADCLLGLIMPTHGFTAPWLMIRFALNLPRSKGTQAVVIPTRAGWKVGPFFLPGMQGSAGYLIALILFLKGYVIRGIIGIDMPTNWTAVHWGLSPATATAIINRARAKVKRFMEVILSSRRYFGGLIELFLGLWLIPVSIGYLIYGRFFFSKLFFASDSCNGCGICARHCPAGAIKMRGPKPYWTFKCENCMRCMNYCPTGSVEASHPLAVILSFVTAIPVADYILNKAGRYLPWPVVINNGMTAFLLQYLYFVTSIFISYLLFSFLNRIPFISRIFAVTTLTHYYRRYHEPGTKLPDVSGRDEA